MRQQQQQRSRNRNRGRKSSNPLSRNFESNGPDVKIRGNASHIAEKYSQLARDALTSGDTVMAENYFQHAEHYNRIVAANQQQVNAQREQSQDNNRDNQNNRNNNPRNAPAPKHGDGPQPEVEEVSSAANTDSDQPAEVNASEETAPEARAPARRNSRRPASPRRNSRVAKKSSDEEEGVKSSKPANGSTGGETLSDDASSLPSSLIGSAGDDVPKQATRAASSEE